MWTKYVIGWWDTMIIPELRGEFEANLRQKEKMRPYQKLSQAWWYIPIIPIKLEAAERRIVVLQVRCWAKTQDPILKVNCITKGRKYAQVMAHKALSSNSSPPTKWNTLKDKYANLYENPFHIFYIC
jgi:hypothetical protein